MDSQNPPKPTHLLNDLESIRRLLDQDSLEPPLLTDSIDATAIPLLSDIITPARPVSSPPKPASPPPVSTVPAPAPAPAVSPAPATPSTPVPPTPARPAAAGISATLQRTLHPSALELNRLDGELRAAAQLMLQDVIDDFVPQIEAELKRRLDIRLNQMLSQRKP